MAVLLLLAASLLATRMLRAQALGNDWVLHTETVHYELSRVLQLFVDAQTGARGYALTGDERLLDTYREASPALGAETGRLQELVPDNPRQRSLAARLGVLAGALAAFNDRLLAAARAGDAPRTRALIAQGDAEQMVGEARSVVAQMQAEENRLMVIRRAVARRAARESALALWATGVLGALLVMLIFYFTRRDEARIARAQQELATILRSIGDAVIATDLNGAIRFINPVAEQLTGWPASSALGQPLETVFRIVNEETRRPVDNPMKLVLEEGKTVGLANHTLLIARDGTERAIADSGAPVLDEKQQVQGMALVFRDVSEERRAERLLQLRDAELRIINDHARFPIARCDAQHRYLFVNRAYSERFGCTPEQCVGKHIRDVAGEEAYQSVRPYIERALSGEMVEFEIEIPYRGVGFRYMYCIYAPERAEDGRVRSFVAATTDITEKKENEKELQRLLQAVHAEKERLARAEAALREADRRKDEFLATLSHELRNPLAPIRTAAEILGSAQPSAQQLHWAQSVIQRQVKHMAWLLDDLLDLARITQGKLSLKKAPVTLNSIVDAAVEAARPLLDDKKHRLSVTLPVAVPILHVDPLRLSQVLSNLLTNAAKYTNPGGHIDLTAKVVERRLVICVKDDGIGVPQDSLERIFEMFSQIEGQSARTEGGLGIGLSLVRGLVALHGGTVEARSEGPGRGSEFIVNLALPAAELTSLPAEELPKTPATTIGRRVLIADDNKDAADALAMLLEMAGHEVRVAHGGRAALALAQAFRPEVALLDIGMPELSGYEVAIELRKQAWAAQMQLFALTGWGQDSDRQRAKEAGFDRHLTKPIDAEVLHDLLTEGAGPSDLV